MDGPIPPMGGFNAGNARHFVHSLWDNPMDGQIEMVEYLTARLRRALPEYEFNDETLTLIVRVVLLEYLLISE